PLRPAPSAFAISHLPLSPRPPRPSPPFPYTTLFRSRGLEGLVIHHVTLGSGGAADLGQHVLLHGVQGLEEDVLTKIGSSSTPEGDRKSTRLNSSHVSISYAVFCLKKKEAVQLRWLRF